jgi:glutamate decarboxylase
MLGALSLKWKWKERRQAANLSTDRPNLVFGGDVHVVWEKFCRYFDVEPRIVPLAENKYTIGPEDVEPHLDENTIGVAAVPGHHVHRHMDDIVGSTTCCSTSGRSATWTSRSTWTAPAAGSCGRSCTPTPVGLPSRAGPLDQRVGAQVRARLPGIGWLVFREESDLAKDLVFYENYLGKTDATFTLNFSTGAAMVLAQYYNFVRLGRDGYTYVMKQMQQNARRWRPTCATAAGSR